MTDDQTNRRPDGQHKIYMGGDIVQGCDVFVGKWLLKFWLRKCSVWDFGEQMNKERNVSSN